MNEFRVIFLENDYRIRFILDLESNLAVAFDINFKTGRKVWRTIGGKESWNHLILNEKRFEVKEEGRGENLTEKQVNQLKEGFYELLRQIKQDPKWRLKIFQLVPDDIRPIWNLV